MIRLLMRVGINAVALWAAAAVVGDITLPTNGDGINIGSLLLIALIFGLVNALIKPVVKLLTFPFYIITLGLFTFVVNAGMLMLTSWFARGIEGGFSVDGFWAALWGGIIISIVSTLLSVFVSDDDDNKRRRD